MRLLAFVNESKQLNSEQVAAMAAACSLQLVHDACPAWHKARVICYVASSLDAVPAWVPRVVFLDDADQANALGYHTLGPDGVPYARVFVGVILASGGGILVDTGGNGNAVSVCASHEALEILGNPKADQYLPGPARLEGSSYAVELADPVQGWSYVKPTSRGDVAVSDFVLPAYFGGNYRGTRFDFLGRLTSQFSIGDGGYLIMRDASGVVRNVFGQSRHAPHPASRLEWMRRGGIK